MPKRSVGGEAAFPATTEELREAARADFAPDDVLSVLEQLTPGERFDVFADVWRAAGGSMETRD